MVQYQMDIVRAVFSLFFFISKVIYVADRCAGEKDNVTYVFKGENKILVAIHKLISNRFEFHILGNYIMIF